MQQAVVRLCREQLWSRIKNPKAELTIELDCTNVAEQLFAIDVSHAWAEAWVAVAELSVHTMQSVRHRVDGVHHKLNLSFLLVAWVPAHFF